MANNRKHSKIDKLPPEIRDAVNIKLTEGFTYQQIAEWIKTQGHDVSYGSVGRYGKGFLAKMEKLRQARDQAKVIVSEARDGPALEMVEAANQMAVQVILERLIEMDDIKGAKSTEVLKALALLERSAVQREKLKLDYNKGVDVAAEQIKAGLREELAKQPDLLAKLSAIIDAKAEEVRQR